MGASMKNDARGSDRRAFARLARDGDHRIGTVRVRPGHHAKMMNVSPGGALIETCRGLSPGRTVDLQIETEQHRTVVRGRVLRCAVIQLLASHVTYRSAIAFDRHLPWFVFEYGYAVPSVEHRLGREERASTTQTVL
jgi:hypothetical protein